MKPTLCSRCKKNVAVIFITKVENGKSTNEGLCLKCAKELGIKQVDEIVERMGITDEDLDNLNSEMNQLIQPEDDEDDIGSRTATFPHMNRLFGGLGNELSPTDEPKKDAPSAPSGSARTIFSLRTARCSAATLPTAVACCAGALRKAASAS